MITPTQQAVIERHRAFKARIAMQAKPDPGISCLSASMKALLQPEPEKSSDPQLPEIDLLNEWLEKQKKAFAEKEPWFQIVAHKPGEIRRIQMTVLKRFPDLQMTDLLGARRLGAVVEARHIGIFLAREFTRHSLPEIGRRFGGRDHTTVLHALRKMERRLKEDEGLRLIVQDIREELSQ